MAPLLLAAAVVLVVLGVYTGGRVYAAGVPTTRVAEALSHGPQPFETVDEQASGPQLDSLADADHDRQGRRQRFRETPPIQVVVALPVVVEAVHLAPPLWRPVDEPGPAPTETPARQPLQPRGP